MARLKKKVDESSSKQKITAEDFELFRLGKKNVNYLTDFYFRSPTSGTYWRRNTPDPEKSAAYAMMYNTWIRDGHPDETFEYLNTLYKIIWEDEDPEYPCFWNHHGWINQDWQHQIYHCEQPEVTCIAGVGVGKTSLEAILLAMHAMTIPNYRGFAVAPQMLQATEIYNYLVNNGQGTVWWDRFVTSAITKPYPKFTIENSHVGISTIEIFSIEKDPDKVLTLEGDEAILDQAEKIEDLDEITQKLGSRLRGTINGRNKLGKLYYMANAGSNPSLWMRYDMAEYEPKVFLSLNPKTWENIYLTKYDLDNLRRRVSPTGSQADVDQWMGAGRPLGAGKHFPANVVMSCHDVGLDQIMEQSIQAQTPGFILEKDNLLGIYHWEMPPDKDRHYVVVGDPGQGNAPYRNSAPIMVWDITEFPTKPAIMRAFHWISGNGSYWPFVSEFQRYVELYHSYGQNAVDSTGPQKGMNELVFVASSLETEGLDMSGNGKYHALNAAKILLGKAWMKYPYLIRLFNQLTNYELPDEKIQQDLVSCLAMSAYYIRRYYFMEVDDDKQRDQQKKIYHPDQSRYSRPGIDRYDRRRV